MNSIINNKYPIGTLLLSVGRTIGVIVDLSILSDIDGQLYKVYWILQSGTYLTQIASKDFIEICHKKFKLETSNL